MIETVTAFLAVNFEIAAARKLAAVQRELQAAPSAVHASWISPTNLRVVLRNIGRIDPALAPSILDPLRETAAALPPVRLQLGPLSAFPSVDRARLVIVDVSDPTAGLADLCTKVDQLLTQIGLAAPGSPFHPHVTLARLQEAAPVAAWLGSLDPLSIEARLTEVVVYLHTQKRPGAEHTALDRFPLAPPPRASQRPSRAPKQPSQRPSKRPRSDANAPRPEAIPAPPRVPSFPAPAAQPLPGVAAPAPTSPPSPSQNLPASGQGQAAPRTPSSILPPAVEAALPPDDDWGT
ncbi:MAG: RNA 2',3'-cyclic phosphodiesterase [Deltaproteobacteria bacterium]|nr:RNA 2',3'-cyclic phosphodiesterase [Deltaproteobacteria bacterium]